MTASVFNQVAAGAPIKARLAFFGVSATYTAWGQNGVSCTVEFEDLGEEERFNDQDTQNVRVCRITCDPADVTSPDPRDKFTIDGVTWAVEAVEAAAPWPRFRAITRELRYIGGKLRKDTSK
jgi:hypothetical protein